MSGTVDGSMATAGTAATSAAAADSDADSSSAEDSDGSSDEDDSSGPADFDAEAASAAAALTEKPPELVTYALEALYEEAEKFSAQWAAENGVAAAAADMAPAGGSSAGGNSNLVTAASAPNNEASSSRAAAGSSAAAAAAAADGKRGASGSNATQQDPPPAAAAAAAAPSPVVASLYELMARQVMQQWSSRQLLASGLMTDFLLEELYAAAGKSSRPLQDFIAHVALNPHTEQQPQHGKRGSKQQQAARVDALSISTIHAAKGLEYGCVWVVRWVDGFLPAWPREDDTFKAKSPAQQEEALRAFRMEEQRLAHVAVTRAKQRLCLTVPQYRVAPNPHRQQTSWQADGRDDNVLAPSDFLNCLTRLAEVKLANDEPVLEAENLRSDRVFD